jgi:hypothetical protein
MSRGDIRNCPTCGVRIPKGKLLCREHWFSVSVATRRAVNATWKEFKRAEIGIPKLMAIKAYRVAYEAALIEAQDAHDARKAA